MVSKSRKSLTDRIPPRPPRKKGRFPVMTSVRASEHTVAKFNAIADGLGVTKAEAFHAIIDEMHERMFPL